MSVATKVLHIKRPRIFPVLDSLDCTVRQAIALARGAPGKPVAGSYAAPAPVPVEGLSPPLAALLDARTTSGGA